MTKAKLDKFNATNSWTGPKRKAFTKNDLDRQTLEILYLDKCMRVTEIAKLTNKTRQRIWQLLKQYNIHNENMTIACLFCGDKFSAPRSAIRSGAGKYCCADHYNEHRREVNDYQPCREGQRIARRVIEAYLGHPLPMGFIVHHEDGNQRNTDLKNLFVFPSHALHLQYHHAKRHGKAELPYKNIADLPDLIQDYLSG